MIEDDRECLPDITSRITLTLEAASVVKSYSVMSLSPELVITGLMKMSMFLISQNLVITIILT